ncbi:MAG TPA: hypothetical protein VF977_08000 [Candidatus Binatia bacterium]
MLNAFEYVMGIYGVSILVTLMVWLVIVAIRWLSGDRLDPTAAKKTQA